MNLTALKFMWSGGETRRYHGFRMLQEDTVGHHSFNVACIIMAIRPDASATLLRAALKHDIAEHIVGDMPAPAKRAMPHYNAAGEGGAEPLTFRQVFADMEQAVAAAAGVDLEDAALTPDERHALRIADIAVRVVIHQSVPTAATSDAAPSTLTRLPPRRLVARTPASMSAMHATW